MKRRSVKKGAGKNKRLIYGHSPKRGNNPEGQLETAKCTNCSLQRMRKVTKLFHEHEARRGE